MKHGKLLVALGIVLALAVAALYIYIYTIPEITGSRTETAIVTYEEMKISKSVDAVLVREETLYRASSAGNVSYYLENNTKTRKDIKILDIFGKSGTTPVYCPVTGVVSFYVDGYEDVLTPGAISSIDKLMPEDWNIEPVNIMRSTVNSGDRLYKLITSESFYTVFMIGPEERSNYTEGASVTLEFEDGSVSAKISDVYPVYVESQTDDVNAETTDSAIEISSEAAIENLVAEGSEPGLEVSSYIVSVVTSKYYEGYDRLRTCKVNVVLKDSKGLLVPNSAITKVDGNEGVYVKGIDGEYTFTRIKVISTDGTDSVVYADTFSVLRDDGLTDTVSSISIYDEILKDASSQN